MRDREYGVFVTGRAIREALDITPQEFSRLKNYYDRRMIRRCVYGKSNICLHDDNRNRTARHYNLMLMFAVAAQVDTPKA